LIIPDKPRKCVKQDEPGRWVSILEHDKPCEVPFCSGDKLNSFVSHMSWQGTRNDWLWVPYNCHFHYYTQKDFGECTNRKGIEWIHVMGDSLAREFVGYLMSVMGDPDTHKFEYADQHLNNTNVRVTFQSWQDILMAGPMTDGETHFRRPTFTKEVLDYYNLLAPGTSQPLEYPNIHLEKKKIETSAPDVFIFNPATAYCLYQQSEESFIKFFDDLESIAGDVFRNGRPDGFKTDLYWYSNPYIFGAAHAGTEHITQGRNERFREIAIERASLLGFRPFDSFHITRARWEESWDGLHFLAGYEQWRGHVAATFVQAWLNELLGSCTG